MTKSKSTRQGLLLFCYFALFPVPLACHAEIISHVKASELGTGNTLAEQTGSTINSTTSSSINYPGATVSSYSGFAEGSNAILNGKKTFHFKLYSHASRSPSDGISVGTETLSAIALQDVLLSSTSGAFFLDFKVNGTVNIAESGNSTAAWEMNVIHDNMVDATAFGYVHASEMDGPDTFFDSIQGWQSFSNSASSFTGIFRAKVYANNPFHLDFNSISSAQDGGVFLNDLASATGDLTHTVTLDEIRDANGNLVSSVLFGSGSTFVSSVPEPGSFLTMAIALCLGASRRRRR